MEFSTVESAEHIPVPVQLSEEQRRILHIIEEHGGRPGSKVCNVIYNYRNHHGGMPLPLNMLPCRDCPLRGETEVE